MPKIQDTPEIGVCLPQLLIKIGLPGQATRRASNTRGGRLSPVFRCWLYSDIEAT
jgi:hypothetical protein